MGRDHVRHVRVRRRPDGLVNHFWEPSRALRELGYSSEPLGTDDAKAYARAAFLNIEAEKDRAAQRTAQGQDLPATAIKRLVAAYEASEEYRDLKKRTQDDYSYWLGFVVDTWGKYEAALLDEKAIKLWLRETAKTRPWNAYHLGLTLRTFLKWCKGEKVITAVPEFVVSTPSPRRVKWSEDQIVRQVEAFEALGWRSLAVGFLVEWCVGQNPCDVWTLKRHHYAAGAIDVTRSKTGVGGDPIPLWLDVRARLDAYLAASPATPEAPLFRNEKTGVEWVESTRAKWFSRARTLAGLPGELQMRDLRRTAITEALRLGFSRGQARALSRHATDQGMSPYDALEASGIVVDVQAARGKARKTESVK